MDDVISRAMHFAIDAYANKRRKGYGEPLSLHAMEAAAIVAALTKDDEVIAAAVLHDVIEDAGVRAETLYEMFGERVTNLVLAETEDKRGRVDVLGTWRTRKQEAIDIIKYTDDIAVKMIFLGDKLSNMRSFANLKRRYGDKMWEQFNQSDPNEHLWYYRTIAELLPELKETLEWIEYDQLIKYVFEQKGA